MAVHGQRILRGKGRLPSAKQFQSTASDASGFGLCDPQAYIVAYEANEDFLRFKLFSSVNCWICSQNWLSHRSKW